MKIQGNIPEGYIKAMDKKDSKELNPKAYINQGKNDLSKLSPDDQLTISFLKNETDENYSRLKDIVKDMLRRQGIEVSNLKHLQDKDVEGIVVDEQARSEAARMIGPDGPMNAENTAERIFKFAKAISGGDIEKYDKLKEAIIGGFDAVKDMLGGELPEISQNTYDLVMEKLDDWAGIEKSEENLVPVEEEAKEVAVEETTEFILPEKDNSIVIQMLPEELEEEPSLIEQMLADEEEETE